MRSVGSFVNTTKAKIFFKVYLKTIYSGNRKDKIFMFVKIVSCLIQTIFSKSINL